MQIDGHRRRTARKKRLPGRAGQCVQLGERWQWRVYNHLRNLRKRRVTVGRTRGRRTPRVVIATAGLPGYRWQRVIQSCFGGVAARVVFGFRHRGSRPKNLAGGTMPAKTQHIQTKQLHQ